MRLLSIPATLIGIALAIIFFKVYGVLSRPAVPRPIALIVDQFAPGVKIGATVAETRYSVAAMSYVPHLGYVGIPGSRGTSLLPNGYPVNFAQVRLLLDERTRREPKPNPSKARIDAVEVVTAEGSAGGELNTAFSMVFRRQPRDGCLHLSEEGKLRDVRVWTTPNELGGVALVTDFAATAAAKASGPGMTNVIAFTGKFDGGRTLRGNYTDASCTLVTQSQ